MPKRHAAAARASLAPALQQAVSLHQQGALDRAEALYRAILKVAADHFDALHLLGVLRQQQGRSQDALRLIAAARIGSTRLIDNLTL